MSRAHALRLTLATIAAGLSACTPQGDHAASPSTITTVPSRAERDDGDAGTRRQYGVPVRVGEGRARTYVVRASRSGAPVEVGVALDQRALDGLPTAGHGDGSHGGHANMVVYLLPMPAQHGTPFQFVQLDWNPAGHPPADVYDAPHFDFHFYTISQAEREAIVPTDPQFAAKANNVPSGAVVPPHYVPLAPPGGTPADLAVPQMGVHWSDTRAPELQKLLGKPDEWRPFTTTFIYGSWDGRFTFLEPMITRAYILARRSAADAAGRDEVIPIPTPAAYQAPGYYPSAYRISWDAHAKEYRVALTRLERRQ